MMTSCNPAPGDIWLAYVEFADHPGVGKVRPVLVVDVHDEICVVFAAKVTSKDLIASGVGECIPILNWSDYGLRKPSYVRTDQRLELAFENLLREEPIGEVSKTFLDLVMDALAQQTMYAVAADRVAEADADPAHRPIPFEEVVGAEGYRRFTELDLGDEPDEDLFE